MNSEPFLLFGRHQTALDVALLTKEDDVKSDAEAGELLGITSTAGLRQVHGTTIIAAHDPIARDVDGDGLITKTREMALCIRWADCQNIVIYAPDKYTLALLHAGWKGMRDGAIGAMFQALRDEYDVFPGDCLVGAGPSLCMNCAEFTDPYAEIPNVPPQFVEGRTVDLQGWADSQMLELGVAEENLERHRDCTRCNPDKYWTYRGGHREQVQNGHTNMLIAALRAA